MKIHLQRMLLGTRGAAAKHLVWATVNAMSEAEAEQWYRLLRNMTEDAHSDGVKRGAREPWRKF